MRFGVCRPYKNAAFVKECGYDYIEPALCEIAGMTDEAFAECKAALAAAGMKAEVCNCFFPGGYPLVGPEVDRGKIAAYVDKAVARAHELGSQILVLGSGGSRNIKEEYDRAACEEQFIAVARDIGQKMQRYGMRLVIEPLNRKETNFINTVPEGADIARRIDLPNVKTMVDFFHHSLVGGTAEDILSSKDQIGYVHVARANADRHVPSDEDMEDVRAWAALVKEIGYTDRVSIEGTFPDFEADAAPVRQRIAVFGE